ncbi:hypothetical protein LCGC14_0367150 [marine sediment metagenome]|uniref:Uncharacterized protein n=1 Tax=marine sediment metagenome TaxID=412755 RepID=A0A0F9TC51_9ZZZZ
MANMNVTPAQVQMAASAGVQLLQVDDLAVPLVISKSGALGMLENLLGAIARGELIVSPNPELAANQPDPPDDGKKEPQGKGRGNLKPVKDDKVN